MRNTLVKYTDHNQPQIDLLQYLPEVYRSDVNTVLSDMVINRYFTKDDVSRVTGYIGTRNQNATINRQIQEETPHRQAFQLTPTMHTKVGTIDTALSFKQFEQQLSLIGVDRDRMPKWGDSIKFNWVPPINIDMIINYQDYFWKDDNNFNTPQYFTIENRCKKSQFRVDAYANIIKQRGSSFSVTNFNVTLNQFIIHGKYVDKFPIGSTFYTIVSNSPTFNNLAWVVQQATYDSETNTTTITTDSDIVYKGSTPPSSPSINQLWLDTDVDQLKYWSGTVWNQLYNYANIVIQINTQALFDIVGVDFDDNSFLITGNVSDIFITDFVFFTKNSSVLLNNFWSALSSTYDSDTNITSVIIRENIAIYDTIEPVTDVIGQLWYNTDTKLLSRWTGTTWVSIAKYITANVSLNEMVAAYEYASSSICGSSVGWDIGLWDDNNIGNVLWNTELMENITHNNIVDWMASNTLENLALWYNPTTDYLYQYGDLQHPDPLDSEHSPIWNGIIGNFSNVLSRTIGTMLWDDVKNKIIEQYDPWSLQNNWIHKSGVQSFSGITRAQVPILEYNSSTELNNWTEVVYPWKYRMDPASSFVHVDTSPSRLELEPIKQYVAHVIDGYWYIYLFNNTSDSSVDVNLTDTFVPGYVFAIIDDNNSSHLYTTEYSEYRYPTLTDPVNVQGDHVVTIVRIQELVFSSAMVGGGIEHTRIIPTLTSQGHPWRGYHVHWYIDLNDVSYKPATTQKLNVVAMMDASQQPSHVAIRNNVEYSTFSPQVGELSYGITFQEFTVDTNQPFQRVDLLDSFKYNPTIPTNYATPNSNELRVYINNVRQLGTYEEIIDYGTPLYTAVDDINSLHINIETITIPYVVAIEFSSYVANIGDIIRIEIGAASFNDMGMFCVPIRTVEDDETFYTNVNDATQPVYVSLTKYQKTDQTKKYVNQYPLFNVYDILDNEVVKVSPIFAYKESSEYPIDKHTSKRIVTSNDYTEFEFIQYLLDTDNGKMYAYRNNNKISNGVYWYNPKADTVSVWDGTSWSQYVNIILDSLTVYKTVVSEIEPEFLWEQEGSLWFNKISYKLYSRSVVNNSWVEITDVIINETDPSLQTIWQHGLNNEKYVPQYVDKDRNPIEIGSVDGDWEVMEQWRFNPEHENKQTISYTQLFTHLQTILSGQRGVPGLANKGTYAYLQDEYQYNIGGTIHEYNHSFDTLVSAINVTNVTPVGVIEFAEEQYNSSLYAIRGLFNNKLPTAFASSVSSLVTFDDVIVDIIISEYESNEQMAKIYGDTTAYVSNTDRGIRNWISTAPMFGLIPSYKPNLVIDGQNIQLIHHDGHRSNLQYTIAEIDNIVRKLIAQIDPRSGLPVGRIGDNLPTTMTEFLNEFTGYSGNDEYPNGVFWYIPGPPPQLYRFELFDASATPPPLSSYFCSAINEVPNGVRYFNTTDRLVYEKDENGWLPITTVPDDITPLWRLLDITALLGKIYLEIENRLYDVSIDAKPVFDYDTLIVDSDDQQTYDSLYRTRFNKFLSDSNIVAALVNTQYSPTNPWTWNYVTSVPDILPSGESLSIKASWQSLYNEWYGTPYPHREPWKMQGYVDKPDWWDDEYLDTTNVRTWKYEHATTTGMWENIKLGIIPMGQTYPSGVISTGDTLADGQNIKTYNYFPVNIDDVTTIDGYEPDSLLPPYYSTTSDIRSLFSDYSQIIAPDADYVFGDGSPVEWNWMTSIQYQYDKIVIAFLMQPVKFFSAAFGVPFTTVDMLTIDSNTSKVYNHKDALFHGDIYNVNDIYVARGLNQWYVNFNRYTGFDTNAEFRQMWNDWVPMLTYQVGGIADTSSLFIDNANFDVDSTDYTSLLVKNGIIKELWLDLFKLTIINTPPSIIQYNNQTLWKFELESLSNSSRVIQYYGVKSYPFIVDTVTNVCQAYKHEIVDVYESASRVYVDGDQSAIYVQDSDIRVNDINGVTTIGNVTSSVYEPGLDRTRVNVDIVVTSDMVNGFIGIDTFVLPWSTGDMVVLYSSKMLPYPLVSDTPYYIIRDESMANNEFRLAETYHESLANVSIDFLTEGKGETLVSEIVSSFNVLGGQSRSRETWYHYALDKTIVHTLTLPNSIKGMQHLINVIDGVVERYVEQGVIVDTADSRDFDPIYGRLSSWQLEIERFIDWAYGIRSLNIKVGDRYEIVVNSNEDTLQYVDMIPAWTPGSRVMLTTTGTLPTPLYANTAYYLHVIEGEYKLSLSSNSLDSSMIIDLMDEGSGRIYISLYDRQVNYPSFEMNPHRNNIWISTPHGVVSNVLQGPLADIRFDNTLVDQYGRQLTVDDINIYRQDKRTRISIRPNISNDIERYYVEDPYNYIHLGGGHIFIEGYEHFILFNNSTVGNDMLYDPFLGLIVTRLNMDYYEKLDYVLRPTLGGYYLVGNEFRRNIEGSATDLANIYDTFAGLEESEVSRRARALLGYAGRSDYLDLLNVNSKSQFLFYRGMIAAKGSVNNSLAYTNSKRFIDAKIDDFWAYKLADFGDVRPRVYPEVKLFSNDNIIDDIRMEFVGRSESRYNTSVLSAEAKGFRVISYYDEDRWNNHPEQMSDIGDSLFMDAEVSSITSLFINEYQPPISMSQRYDYWYNTQDNTLYQWSGTDWSIVVNEKIHQTADYTYWRHNTICDDVRIIQDNIRAITTTFDIVNVSVTNNTFSIIGDHVDSIYGGMVLDIKNSTGNNGHYQIAQTSYDRNDSTTVITVVESVNDATVDGKLVVDVLNLNDYNSIIMTQESDDSTTSYHKVNSEVIRFSNIAFRRVLRIYTINPSKNKTSPAKLIDIKSNVVVEQIPLWHPALGYHYYIAEHNVDLQHPGDPARYTNTINIGEVSDNPWNFGEEGLVWLDTSYLGYIPYYDTTIYPNVEDRIANWGKLADFGRVRVCEWKDSPVHPADWERLVANQRTDTTITQNNKATGIARTEIFVNSRSLLTGYINLQTSEIEILDGTVDNDDAILFSANSATIPEGVALSTTYYVSTPGTGLTTFTLSDTKNYPLTFEPLTQVIKVVGYPIGTQIINDYTVELLEHKFESPIGLIQDGDIIVLNTTGILPFADPVLINETEEYEVTDVYVDTENSHQTFSLVDVDLVPTSSGVLQPDGTYYYETGKGTLTATIIKRSIVVAPGFKNDNWSKRPFIRKHGVAPLLTKQDAYPITNPTLSWVRIESDPVWYDNELVDVYVNGKLSYSGNITVTNGGNDIELITSGNILILEEYDIVDIVRSYDNINLEFDPTVEDNGTETIWWKQDYEYTSTTLTDQMGNDITTFYFWVEGSTNVPIGNNKTSINSIATALAENPAPYFIVQKPLDIPGSIPIEYGYDIPPYGTIYSGGEADMKLYDQFPIAYRQVIVSKVASYVSTNDRYMIRFTKDLVLRDNLRANNLNINLKNIHEEWILFRKEQQHNIPIELWNKMVEALSGESLRLNIDQEYSAVPSLDRVLYDQIYHTETRYGLGVDQAFVDKELGLATVLNYLNDPTIDFQHINIEEFFSRHSFDTPDNIKIALFDIYNSFGYTHVNHIWFDVLQDALSNKSKYIGLLKTSWVSVHGVQVLEVNGIFDE